MATIARLLLLAPNFYNTTSSRLTSEEEIKIIKSTIAKLLCVARYIFLTICPFIYVFQFTIIFWSLSKLFTELSKANIVHLSQATNIPTAKITHIVIDKEVVGLNIISPAIFLTVTPSITFAMYNKT